MKYNNRLLQRYKSTIIKILKFDPINQSSCLELAHILGPINFWNSFLETYTCFLDSLWVEQGDGALYTHFKRLIFTWGIIKQELWRWYVHQGVTSAM